MKTAIKMMRNELENLVKVYYAIGQSGNATALPGAHHERTG
jgi:hypothetical protein